MRHFYNTARYVGAMVGNTFQICEQVGPDEAHFYGAVACLHTYDVVGAELVFEVVYNLLKRLYLVRKLDIVFVVRIELHPTQRT